MYLPSSCLVHLVSHSAARGGECSERINLDGTSAGVRRLADKAFSSGHHLQGW